MKTQPTLLFAMLLLIAFGCDDLPIGFENNIGPSALSGKPPILKISYTEVAQRKAEFAKGTPKDHSLTYIEEPRSERKKVYIEIYADLTYGKQVQYLPPESDFPADRWILPADMPEVKKIIYSDGFAKGYDDAGNLLLEEPFEDTYWIDPARFSSVEAARNFLLNSYFKPKANASETLNAAKKFSDSFSMTGDEMAVATNTFSPESPNQNLPSSANLSSSAAPSNDEVVQEKNYFLPAYGVVYRTEGYTADGSLKDIEQHFYKFTKDSAFVMVSTHYRNKRHSAAYDLSFVEHSDIFFKDYLIVKNNNFENNN